MSNKTFTMIKPDGVANNYIGPILAKINEAGFRIVAMKYTRLTPERAGEFYAVHKERPFYNDLVKYMSSGPIVAAILKKVMPLKTSEKSLVQQILQKQKKELFVISLQNQLKQMQFTVQTAMKML